MRPGQFALMRMGRQELNALEQMLAPMSTRQSWDAEAVLGKCTAWLYIWLKSRRLDIFSSNKNVKCQGFFL